MCEIIKKNKSNDDNPDKVPTIKQLYNIIQELAVNYKNMQEKVEEMQKILNKGNNKVNIIKYLNDSNSKINITFNEWIKTINIVEHDVNNILEDNFGNTINKILVNNLKTDTIIPIQSFVQKSIRFYIYENNSWKLMDEPEFIYLLKAIHSKLLKALCMWRNNNQDKFNINDKLFDIYNRAIIKLMDTIEFKQYTLLNQIRIKMYNILKKELNNITVVDLS